MKIAFLTMSIPAAAALLLLLLPITVVSAEQPYCDFTTGPCISGCWNPTPVDAMNMNDSTLRLCEPTGTGFYSPSMNDARIMCEAGTYSYSSVAGICDECPKGTYSTQGASECTLCPADSYSRFSGSDSCTECDGEFSGPGSNAVRLVPMQDGRFATFCAGGGPLVHVPTASPTVSMLPSTSPSDMSSTTPSVQPTQASSAPPSFNLHPTDIHNDNPADDETGESDTTSIPRHNDNPAVDETGYSIPTPLDSPVDEKRDDYTILIVSDDLVDDRGETDTTSIVRDDSVDERGATTSIIPRVFYPVMAVAVVTIGSALLAFFVVKNKNKKESTKRPRRFAVLLSSLPVIDEEGSCESPASAQEIRDGSSTGSLEEVSPEDDEDNNDVERGTSTLFSDVSESREWDDTNTTSTENVNPYNLGTPAPRRSLFPAGSVAAFMNMRGIAYLKKADLKSIQKSHSEEVAGPWPFFDVGDSWSWGSRASVSETNDDDHNSDVMSSNTSSVYLEDTGSNYNGIDSSDSIDSSNVSSSIDSSSSSSSSSSDSSSIDSSISSHPDWEAEHAGETFERTEI